MSVKDGATMNPRSVREYVEAVRPRYLEARKRGKKGQILTEFCATTGYHRDSAIRLLGARSVPSGQRRGRPRTYGFGVAEALRQLWEAADKICSKRLHPFLPELLSALEHHGEIDLPPEVRSLVLALGSATLDRLLKPYRQQALPGPYSQSRSASTLKALVPVRTFGEWEGVAVGSMQMDLVMHCGERLEGFHLTTLVAVDVATGWSDCRGVWGKGKDRVGAGAHHIRTALPFPLVEMHTDNGGEFINDVLYPWCRRHDILFTRGRPYKKNDQAHVEQKNWTLVRQRVGYDRFATKAAYEQLEMVYRPLRLYANFFQPLRKLIGKQRVGSKVVKEYDVARTPYRRLLETGMLGEEPRIELEQRYQSLNPARLRAEIEAALEGLWKLAERPGEPKRRVACG
jgi:hypothetical protein